MQGKVKVKHKDLGGYLRKGWVGKWKGRKGGEKGTGLFQGEKAAYAKALGKE